MPDVDDDGGITTFGFRWGPVTVERSATFVRAAGRWRVLRIISRQPTQDLEIYISPTGRRIRAFRGGRELTAR